MEGDTDDMRGQTLPSSWDAAPAQRFFVHIVSFILYARGSFPADCFRRISYEQWEAPDSTHDTLLESGDSMTFSMDSRDYIPAQSGPFIYPRRSKNVRLDGFLNSLEGTLAAIQQQRLGRYRICFSRSKAQDPDALVESYDLEFCYTEEGSLFVDVKWKGVNDTIIPKGCKDPFNTFFKTRSPITGTFYTHPFMYFNDGKPLDHEVDHNLENFLKQAVPLLKQKPHSGSGRIDTLVYHPEAHSHRNKRGNSPTEADNRDRKASFKEQSRTFERGGRQFMPGTSLERAVMRQGPDRMATCFSVDLTPEERLLHKRSPRWRARHTDNVLSVYEKASDELPPTQFLSIEQLPRQRRSSLQRPKHHLTRSRESSLLRPRPKKTPRSSQVTSEGRHPGSSTRSLSTDAITRLDASQLQPISSAKSTPNMDLRPPTN